MHFKERVCVCVYIIYMLTYCESIKQRPLRLMRSKPPDLVRIEHVHRIQSEAADVDLAGDN